MNELLDKTAESASEIVAETQTGDYWTAAAMQLQKDLTSRGISLDADREVIEAHAGFWYNHLSEHVKLTIISVMLSLQTGDYWTDAAVQLQKDLASRGISLDANREVIEAHAGFWYTHLNENIKTTLITAMRNLPPR